MTRENGFHILSGLTKKEIRQINSDEADLIVDVATGYVEALDFQMRQSLGFFTRIIDTVDWTDLSDEQRVMFACMHQAVLGASNQLRNAPGTIDD